MIANAMNWWVDGLTAFFVAVGRMIRPPRRYRLDSQSRPFVLYAMGGSPDRLGAIEIPDDVEPANLPEAILTQTRGSTIEIAVPSAAILERRIDPLPGESRPYVKNVVQHQIESIFPWRAADILFAAEVADGEGGRIDVTVRGTPRSAIAPALALAAARAQVRSSSSARTQNGMAAMPLAYLSKTQMTSRRKPHVHTMSRATR